MKLDELRKHLRAELESEPKPKREPTATEKAIIDYVKRSVDTAVDSLKKDKRCFKCGKPCSCEDKNGTISIVLCPDCAFPTRKCERCGEAFEIELEVAGEETRCPVCEREL